MDDLRFMEFERITEEILGCSGGAWEIRVEIRAAASSLQ